MCACRLLACNIWKQCRIIMRKYWANISRFHTYFVTYKTILNTSPSHVMEVSSLTRGGKSLLSHYLAEFMQCLAYTLCVWTRRIAVIVVDYSLQVFQLLDYLTLTLTSTVAIWTAIKHPLPDRVKPLFVIFDIRALWRSALSVRVRSAPMTLRRAYGRCGLNT